jgi:NADP-dependent 3-hydroxy acid dehydrogenase YdfG
MNEKVVAITGASSWIGAASALLLSGRGAKVLLGARRTEHLERLATRITHAGGEAAYVETDVKRREDLVALVELACARSAGSMSSSATLVSVRSRGSTNCGYPAGKR